MEVARVAPCLRIALLVISCAVGACGCVAMKGYPATSYDPRTELAALTKYYGPNFAGTYEAASDPNRKKSARDEVLNGRIRAIDIQFVEFQRKFYSEAITGNVGTDIGVLLLGAAGAVTGSASTKAALSATSGGVVGAKASIDKNVYFEKTISVLISRMIAERKRILAHLREQMQLPDESYSLYQGLVDVEDYYFAGTIPGAIQQVSTDAGKVSQDADRRLENVLSARTATFVNEQAQKRVDALLAAVDSVPATRDAAMVALAVAPPTTAPDVEASVTARDPRNLRSTNPTVAREVTKMRITLMPRDAATLDKWEAALRSAAGP